MKEIIIRPKPAWMLIDFEELWHYRELLYIFSWRDIKVKYKQTFLGVLWVIFQPLFTTSIFTVFFGNLAKIPSGELPYSLFVLCGLVFWTFFSSAVSHASDSMVANENIIKKVYFPKIILPLSSITTSLVDFFINIIFLFIYALVLGFVPKLLGLVIIPLAIILTSLTAFGLGLLLSSINVKYRDVRYILPFFIQILLFLTPIIYPLTMVGERNKIIMALNPMTSVIESVRFVFSPNYMIRPELIFISVASSILILFISLWYFRRTEQFFADIV
jgi:lipopolysaccharide transport system permease protein